MTDPDLRELDGWIAVHFFGLTICPGEYDHILTEYNQVLLAPSYSSNPSAFALVKREIEWRGWEWACAYERKTEHLNSACVFTVYVIREPETNAPICYDKLAASEELAGCLAVKAVVEGSNG